MNYGKQVNKIAASESPAEIKKLSKDKAFAKVGADTVHLINECTGSNIEVPEGEEVVNMCKGMEGFGEMKREEGVLDTLRDLVHKGLLAVKDAAEQAGMSTEEFQQKMQER